MPPSGSAAGPATGATGAKAAQTADDQCVEFDRCRPIEKRIQQAVVMRRGQVERLPDRLLFRAGVPPPEPFELEHCAFAIGEWRPLGSDPSLHGAGGLDGDIAARHVGRFERGRFERGRFERDASSADPSRVDASSAADSCAASTSWSWTFSAWPAWEVSSTSPSRGRGGRGRRPETASAGEPSSLASVATAISGATSISVATSERATRAMSTRVPSSPDV